MEQFDYVALGHIHNAQKVGRETVRYSGCPMYYDFSEITRSKALTLVTVHSKTDIKIEKIDIELQHTLLKLTGTLDELIEKGIKMNDKDKYYIQCVICDKHRPPHVMERLRDVFGNSLVNVKIFRDENDRTLNMTYAVNKEKSSKLGIDEQFTEFYNFLENEFPDSEQEDLIRLITEQQERHSGEYYTDDKNIPEKDSQELIDFLINGKED